jgi:hypothetical protein
MSASEQQRADWLEPGFWDRLDRLESRRKRAQSQHDSAQRDLERFTWRESAEFRQAWERYCEVISELDCAAAEIEALRTCAS